MHMTHEDKVEVARHAWESAAKSQEKLMSKVNKLATKSVYANGKEYCKVSADYALLKVQCEAVTALVHQRFEEYMAIVQE